MDTAFWTAVLTVAGINAIITTGLYLSNAAGALSSAHAAIAGMGGYAGAIATTNHGLSIWVGMVAGGVVGVLVGALLALLTLKMNEMVAGLTTLAFGETVVVMIYNIDYLGGANSFTGIPLYTTLSMVYVMVAVCLWIGWRFDYSRLGYAAASVRHSSVAAAAMGINVAKVKILSFALGGMIAAVGGVLNAHYLLVQSAGTLGFWASVNFIIFWALGGSYSFLGPTFCAILLTIVPEALRFSENGRFIGYGVLLVVLLIFRPQGLFTRIHVRPRSVERAASRVGVPTLGVTKGGAVS